MDGVLAGNDSAQLGFFPRNRFEIASFEAEICMRFLDTQKYIRAADRSSRDGRCLKKDVWP